KEQTNHLANALSNLREKINFCKRCHNISATIDWIPCGRKLTCSYPGIRMHYGPDSYFGNEVSVLEVDGQFDRLEELIYIEQHLSNLSTKTYGEMTELLLKHREYPGSKNGSGLFQVLVGLKMRATYEKLTAKVEQAVA
ncbi:MAG: hypothetical protein AAF152_12615, partial [Cyanobacteria bacterium P01_A01_bin.114]